MAVCRATSTSIAFCTKRKLLRFFSSQRVPRRSSPAGRMETFASQRRLPSSRLPSLTPMNIRISRSARRYATASALERRSGAPTISMSGTPARFRSTTESPPTPWMFLPASSSMWTRMIPTRACTVHPDVEVTVGRERLLVLADLVPLGQIRIKVVLPREDAALMHGGSRAASAARTASSTAWRFTTGSAPATRAVTGSVAVRGVTEGGRARAEELGRRE
jgi:hypothetical protein